MKALILAAGYATRLYPLTQNFPKPLLDIGRRRMIDFLLDRLRPLSISEIIVVTNRKFFPHFQDWAKNGADRISASGAPSAGVSGSAALRPQVPASPTPADIGRTPPLTVLDDGSLSESDRLGAIGDMAFSVKTQNIREDLLVIAGDNLFDFSLEPFVEKFQMKNKPLVGLYEFPRWNHLSKYGIVTLDDHDRFQEMAEKPERPKSNLVSMCLYAFPRQSLPWFDEYLSGPDPRDAPGNYIRWLMTQSEVFGHRFRGTWLDIGDMESLEEARKIFSEKE